MLAANDELKSEFKRAMFIDNTLKEEAGNIAPSSRSTMQLFSTLGISYSNKVPDISNLHKYSILFIKYFKKALPSVITAILVSVGISWYFHSNNDGNSVKTVNLNNLNNSSALFASDYPLMSSYIFDNSNSNTQHSFSNNSSSGNTIFKHLKTENHRISEKITLSNIVKNNAGKYIADLGNSRIAPLNTDLIVKQNITPANNNSLFYNNISISDNSDKNKLGVSVSFIGTEDKSLKNIMLPETSHPIFSRNGVEILYSANELLKIGIDLRQEYFFQEYKGHIEGKYYQIYQHPNLFTAGVTAKVKIAQLFTNTSLVSKLGAGVNIAGPVLRTMIGIDFDPSDDFGFSVGIENSNLFYFNDKKALYVTPKLGVNYSIKFNL
jgi:hypothetical protein